MTLALAKGWRQVAPQIKITARRLSNGSVLTYRKPIYPVFVIIESKLAELKALDTVLDAVVKSIPEKKPSRRTYYCVPNNIVDGKLTCKIYCKKPHNGSDYSKVCAAKRSEARVRCDQIWNRQQEAA